MRIFPFKNNSYSFKGEITAQRTPTDVVGLSSAIQWGPASTAGRDIPVSSVFFRWQWKPLTKPRPPSYPGFIQCSQGQCHCHSSGSFAFRWRQKAMLLFFQLVDSGHLLGNGWSFQWKLSSSSATIFHLTAGLFVCVVCCGLRPRCWHLVDTHNTDPLPPRLRPRPRPRPVRPRRGLPATGPGNGSSASLFTHRHRSLQLPLRQSSWLFIVSWCALLLLTRKARASILLYRMSFVAQWVWMEIYIYIKNLQIKRFDIPNKIYFSIWVMMATFFKL